MLCHKYHHSWHIILIILIIQEHSYLFNLGAWLPWFGTLSSLALLVSVQRKQQGRRWTTHLSQQDPPPPSCWHFWVTFWIYIPEWFLYQQIWKRIYYQCLSLSFISVINIVFKCEVGWYGIFKGSFGDKGFLSASCVMWPNIIMIPHSLLLV